MARPRGATNVVFLPSASGGLGHITRTLKLARVLERADSSLRISYALFERHLRLFNVAVVESSGYPVRILPDPPRQERDGKVRAVLGDADVVIDDTCLYPLPYRRILPRLKTWISIPMLPLWDEVFMFWPLFEQVDHILYAYPSVMPLPEELEVYRHKLTVTGPILDPDELPTRAVARRRLGLTDDERFITYAPRGFPFGREFGRRVLRTLVAGVQRLRREWPELRLVLTAVPDLAAIQPPRLPPLQQIEGLVICGVLPPEQALDYLAAADLVVVEGTSTLFDAAVARTPVLMVPGPIFETQLEGRWVGERDAGVVVEVETLTPGRMAASLRKALQPEQAARRAARLAELVGTGGRDRAVETVLRVIGETAN
jgi:hypothetical protein